MIESNSEPLHLRFTICASYSIALFGDSHTIYAKTHREGRTSSAARASGNSESGQPAVGQSRLIFPHAASFGGNFAE